MSNSYYQFETPLTLSGDPVNPMHAVTKQYVDNKVSNVDGSRFVSGTIPVEKLPAFSGDVYSRQGTNVLHLSDTGVSVGIYNRVTVDSKGRITQGSFTGQELENLSWNIVQNKPTTLAGYGISDVVSTAQNETVASISMTGAQSTAANAAVTKATVDAAIGGVTIEGAFTGEIVKSPESVTPAGYLRANGGMVDKTLYSALYAVIGDRYTNGSSVPTDKFQLPDFSSKETDGLYYYIKA